MPNFFYPQFGVSEYIKNAGGTPTTVTVLTPKVDAEGDPLFDRQGGRQWDESKSTITVVKAIQTSTKVPVKIQSELGQYRSFDFEFYTTDISYDKATDEWVFPNDDIEKDPIRVVLTAVSKAPELKHGNEIHRITNIEPTPIGMFRIICQEERR